MKTTERSIIDLRRRGWIVGLVEKRIPYANIVKDLFGFIDIVAIKPGVILGVQATSYSELREHFAKIFSEQRHLEWLNAGGRILIQGHRKRKGRWEVTDIEINYQGRGPFRE